ncbi:protein GAPT [Psammomys obesus]|uniref:protein GAPT n=1 Tax=Psammomys obesus TaxID=48139 RepID=UPI0024537360|nr:protein GAPT [Psammomys obesus]
MLKSFVSSSVAVVVSVSLLIVLLVYGIGCVWRWKRRETTPIILPKFMQRRSNRQKDCVKTLSLRAHVTGSSPKISVESKGPKSSSKRNKANGNYENVSCPLHTEAVTDKALYENTQPSNLEEHVYCNQTDALYHNFQKPSPPPAPQEEDIYILPDSY